MSRPSFLAVAALALSACTSTRLVSEHVGPATLDEPLRTVLVVGVSDDVGQRSRFERAFGDALERRAGIAVTAATSVVPPERSLERDVLRGALDAGRYDGVLLVRKVGERTDVTTATTGPGVRELETSAYDEFHGRYLGTIRAGTTEKVTRVVRAEVTLLRTADFAEVWTAATDSIDPRELDPTASDIAAITVERLRAHGLLPR